MSKVTEVTGRVDFSHSTWEGRNSLNSIRTKEEWKAMKREILWQLRNITQEIQLQ